MKKLFFVILLLIGIQSSAQLTFDKTILDCENKWVAFPEEGGFHKYGFVYMDLQDGLIFEYCGNLKIAPTGKILAIPNERGATLKIRMYPSKILLAIIPEENYDQLKITKFPNWQNLSEMKEGSIEHLHSWGSVYNAWGECKKALEPLEKAYKINSEYKGLAIELAHTYNCLGQYDKAINLLKKAVIVNPADAYITKEYIFALVNKQQLDTAIDIYRKSLKVSTDTTYVSENAFYILQGYFFRNDKKNFDKWLAETNVANSSNAQIKKLVEGMKIEMKKIR